MKHLADLNEGTTKCSLSSPAKNSLIFVNWATDIGSQVALPRTPRKLGHNLDVGSVGHIKCQRCDPMVLVHVKRCQPPEPSEAECAVLDRQDGKGVKLRLKNLLG